MRPAAATNASVLIMASLSGGPSHGWAIMNDILAMCGVRLGPGTLYAAISDLEARGLIEALATEGRRRPYRLTDPGQAALLAQLQVLQGVVTACADRLDRKAPS